MLPTKRVVKKPNEEEIKDLNRLLATGEPYEVLDITAQSTRREISNKYRELSRKNKNDETMKIKLNNSYELLTNERLRQVYDMYLYSPENQETMDYSNLEPLSELKEYTLIGLQFGSTLLTFPFSKVSAIINSSKTIVKTKDVFKEIYRVNGIKGFFKGSFIGSLTLGGLFTIIDSVFQIIVTPQRFSPPVFHFLDTIVPAIYKHPELMIFDAIDVFPQSMSILNIFKLLFGINSNQDISSLSQFKSIILNNLTLKNVTHAMVGSIFSYFFKRSIEHTLKNLSYYYYYGSINNPNSKYFYYGNLIFNNIFSRSALISLATIPIETIRIAYSRQIFDSVLNNLPLPISKNPISMAISIYKNNGGLLKFFNGIVPFYIVILLDEFCRDCNQTIQDSYTALDQMLEREEQEKELETQ